MKKGLIKLGVVSLALVSGVMTPVFPSGTNNTNTVYAKTTKSGKFSFNTKGHGIYKTNKATMKITNVKVMPSSEDGKQVMVFECDITNHTKKEFDLLNGFNPYEFVHGFQKTSTSNKNLELGDVALDDNGNSPEQTREDVMSNDSVLPGKTVQGVFSFTLVNDKKVTLKFADKDYATVGKKSYKVTQQVTQ
jgi:hypothetical protein